MNDRFIELEKWYRASYPSDSEAITMVSGDASFRKFYRAKQGILMDAPPATEKNVEFINLSNLLNKYGISAPVVKKYDLEKGVLLVSDLGNETFAKIRNSDNMENLYFQAVDLLIKFSDVPTDALPVYDQAFILREDNICREWYFEKTRGQVLSGKPKEIFESCENLWLQNDLDMPQIAVHRDYHSRNIMYKDGNLSVVDFQDMVKGPLTYDLASLLKDCYFRLPKELIKKCIERAWKGYTAKGIITNVSLEKFTKWLDYAALQRHVKCVGIFRRLFLRDNKPGYLGDIPLVIDYIKETSNKYAELNELSSLFQEND